MVMSGMTIRAKPKPDRACIKAAQNTMAATKSGVIGRLVPLQSVWLSSGVIPTTTLLGIKVGLPELIGAEEKSFSVPSIAQIRDKDNVEREGVVDSSFPLTDTVGQGII